MKSSWPWMAGISTAIADPNVAPNDRDDDDRPAVKDLISEHRTAIDKVQIKLEDHPLYDPTKHDDLWILRFLLSHKLKISSAIAAARQVLLFRQKHRLDEQDIRHTRIHKDDPNIGEGLKTYLSCCSEDAINFCVLDGQRGVTGYLYAKGIRHDELLKHCTDEDRLYTFCYISEWTHQWLDYVTRTTGRLTKAVRLLDASGFGWQDFSYKNTMADGKAMGVMEDCYPQLLKCVYICNPPSWIYKPWRVLRPILPKRVVEKVDFVNPKPSAKEKKRLSLVIDPASLPSHFGGLSEEEPVSKSCFF